MDQAGSSLTLTPFRCACTREFTQESAYTKHQGSCTKGKNDYSPLCLKQFAGLSTAPSSAHAHLPNGSFPSADPLEHTGSSLQENAPTSASNADLGAPPMELDADQDLSLAQRRSWCMGVSLPLHYRQYEDVLPKAPPSVPSGYTALAPELDAPANLMDASTSARASS
ncbi:hypothetical protein DFJ58DRAFT_723191 [Suillus subalutaceus]|uniref:uncharacterized protein n=1 Tax=Suillus subalutaceus TaxID=48586 RepID=UPI001B871567|nr:uncharacterized protein DFJ58DRAFT_723191 [Suillus subalutaceus]KAG1869344.1 hypothetical protein DFJ58DRAFT_723191 [Suillus subalutaceus]